MKMENQKNQFHFLILLLLGMSSSLWAVMDRQGLMSALWLFILWGMVLVIHPKEITRFLKRLFHIGSALIVFSLLQIIFRRQGIALLKVGDFTLITFQGLREAVLLWIRFMILFALAFIMARISLFHFLLFTNKIRVPLNIGLLLLMTMKLIPFIFSEAKRGLWFFRFRGLRFRDLSIKQRVVAGKQLVYALLMRSMNYLSDSALALELRGYGRLGHFHLSDSYPLHIRDWAAVFILCLVNGVGFWFYV